MTLEELIKEINSKSTEIKNNEQDKLNQVPDLRQRDTNSFPRWNNKTDSK